MPNQTMNGWSQAPSNILGSNILDPYYSVPPPQELARVAVKRLVHAHCHLMDGPLRTATRLEHINDFVHELFEVFNKYELNKAFYKLDRREGMILREKAESFLEKRSPIKVERIVDLGVEQSVCCQWCGETKKLRFKIKFTEDSDDEPLVYCPDCAYEQNAITREEFETILDKSPCQEKNST